MSSDKKQEAQKQEAPKAEAPAPAKAEPRKYVLTARHYRSGRLLEAGTVVTLADGEKPSREMKPAGK